MKQYYANVEKDLERFKKEIEVIEDKISKAGDDKKELERELSRALFKCAICEGILAREKVLWKNNILLTIIIFA